MAIPVSGIDGSVVGFSQTINRGLVGVTALLLPFLIILAALVVVLTDLLSRRLLLPLSNLTGASRRIAGGDLVTPVAVAPGPQGMEIGTLEMALEGMRKRLAGQHQIIEASQRNLEQRVEERTSELRQRNDELATLNSVSADLSRSLVLSDVATGAAEQLRQLWRVSQVSVYLLDQTAPDGVRLVGQSMEGDPGDDPRHELSAALVMSDQTSARPMQVDDLVVVPLQVTGTKVGYLVLRQAQLPGRRQIEMLEVVGGQLALALRNAQLFADTQEMATINERNRIAREIHDTIAQGLAGIIIQLQAADAWMEREPKRSQQALGHAAALARSSLQEARRSVWDLRPELLERGVSRECPQRGAGPGPGSDRGQDLGQATGPPAADSAGGYRGFDLPHRSGGGRQFPAPRPPRQSGGRRGTQRRPPPGRDRGRRLRIRPGPSRAGPGLRPHFDARAGHRLWRQLLAEQRSGQGNSGRARDPRPRTGLGKAAALIRVLVADDHPVVRQGICAMLEIEPDIEVVADVGDGAEAVERALQDSPDVVLMDVQMAGLDGIEALRRIRSQRPQAKVVMLTTFGHENYVVPSLKAGAMGYLLKDVGRAELIDSIRRVAAGESLLERASVAEEVQLSHRELEVLSCMAAEMSNREIAERLFLSENTVKTHVSHILNKLGAADRAGAVLRAWRQGLISDAPVPVAAPNHPGGG